MKKSSRKRAEFKPIYGFFFCLVLCLALIPSVGTKASLTKISAYAYETDELVTGTPKAGASIKTDLEHFIEANMDEDDAWLDRFNDIIPDESGGFGKWLYTPKGSSTETVLTDGKFDRYGKSELTLKEAWAGGTIRVRYIFDEGDDIVILYSKPYTIDSDGSTNPDTPPVITDTAITAKKDDPNEVQFGKTYQGENTGWLYGNPAQHDYYHFTVSNLPADSVVRLEIESSDVVKYRFGDKDEYMYKYYYDANPGDITWGKNSGPLHIFISAKSNWKIKFSRENFDYGSVKMTWNGNDLVGGKILKDKTVRFTLDYIPGTNFGVKNTGFYILDDESVANGWVVRNGKSGDRYQYTYRASKIGQDTLTIRYGMKGVDYADAGINTTKKIPINVCPPKPDKPIKITGNSTSITLNHLKTTTHWKAEILKGGKWVYAGSTTGSAIRIAGLKANTVYNIRIFDYKPAAAGAPELCSQDTTFAVKTAPNVKPVIKSVKISGVKQNYHPSQYNPGKWVGSVYNQPSRTQPYWTTSFKVTVTMKNLVPGSSSRCINMKMKKGVVITKAVKGNKKKYTFTVSLMGKYKAGQLKGKVTTVNASTDAAGLIVGPTSKAVKMK